MSYFNKSLNSSSKIFESDPLNIAIQDFVKDYGKAFTDESLKADTDISNQIDICLYVLEGRYERLLALNKNWVTDSARRSFRIAKDISKCLKETKDEENTIDTLISLTAIKLDSMNEISLDYYEKLVLLFEGFKIPFLTLGTQATLANTMLSQLKIPASKKIRDAITINNLKDMVQNVDDMIEDMLNKEKHEKAYTTRMSELQGLKHGLKAFTDKIDFCMSRIEKLIDSIEDLDEDSPEYEAVEEKIYAFNHDKESCEESICKLIEEQVALIRKPDSPWYFFPKLLSSTLKRCKDIKSRLKDDSSKIESINLITTLVFQTIIESRNVQHKKSKRPIKFKRHKRNIARQKRLENLKHQEEDNKDLDDLKGETSQKDTKRNVIFYRLFTIIVIEEKELNYDNYIKLAIISMQKYRSKRKKKKRQLQTFVRAYYLCKSEQYDTAPQRLLNRFLSGLLVWKGFKSDEKHFGAI